MVGRLSFYKDIKAFMVHPEKSDWMDQIVLEWSHKNKANIIRATDKGYLAEHAKEHQEQIKHKASKLAGHAEDVKEYYDKLNETSP